MSQVFVEFTQVAASSGARDTPVSLYSAAVEELTSAAGAVTTTAVTPLEAKENVVTVINNGTDTIWVSFGAVAVSGTGRPVAPNTTRDFGNVPAGFSVSVINDS